MASIVLIYGLLFLQLIGSTSYQFENHTVSNGLPSNFVKDIFQDRNGNIWVATDFGLTQIQSNTKKVYRSVFLSPYIKEIHDYGLKDSILVIGSGDIRVGSYQNGNWTFNSIIPVTSQENENEVYAPIHSFKHENGSWWFSEPHGFSMWNGVSLQRFTVPQFANSKSIYRGFRFHQTNKDELIILSQQGYIWKYNFSKKSLVMLPDNPLEQIKTVDASYQINSNKLLIGGEQGLFLSDFNFKGTVHKLVTIPQVVDIIKSNETDTYWVASKTGSLYLIKISHDSKSASIVQKVEGFHKIKSLLLDSQNNLWVGTDEGIRIMTPTLFKGFEFPSKDSFIDNITWDGSNAFYAATKQHIYKVNPFNKNNPIREIGELPTGSISGMGMYQNTLILGDYSGKLYELNGKDQLTFFGQLKTGSGEFKDSDISHIIKGDGLWVTSTGGNDIHHFELSGMQSVYHIYQNKKIIPIHSIAYDSSANRLFTFSVTDKIWVNQIDAVSKTQSNFLAVEIPDTTDILTIQDVQLFEDKFIFLATSQGIVQIPLQPEQDLQDAYWISKFQNFPYYLIKSIRPITDEMIWVGAEHGVFIFDKNFIINYSTEDGLLSSMSTCLEWGNGFLLSGHVNGLSMAEFPIDFKTSSKKFDIKDLQVDDKWYDVNQTIELKNAKASIWNLSIGDNTFPKSDFVYFVKSSGQQWQPIFNLNDFQLYFDEDHNQKVSIVRFNKRNVVAQEQILHFSLSKRWTESVWFYVFQGLLLVLFFYLWYWILVLKKRQNSALRSLNQTREQIATIINTAPVFIFSALPNGVIRMVEGKAYSEMELEKEELVGKSLFNLFKSEAFHHAFNGVLNGLSQNVIVDRNSRSYEVNLLPVYEKNGLTTINGIGVDITQQVHSERYLRLANDRAEQMRYQAEQANKAKSKFLANMSHELRTPLNAIIGYAQLLNMDKDLSQRQRQFIKTMQSSGHHLLNMINDILDLSKIESGQLELVNTVFSLKSILTETENIFRLQAHEKGLQFQTTITEDLPGLIEADEPKIRQILMNLVSNAVKYTERGTINCSVWIKEKHTKSQFNSTLFVFEITDTGRGIPEDQLHEIFLPFRQVKGHFSKGTGLGLTITKNLVELMGGSISVHSIAGKGSTFKVELPLKVIAEESAESPQQMEYALVPGKSIHALIVDDIDSNRLLLDEMLQSIGFETTSMDSGKDALKLLKEKSFDLVFLDLNMPELSGEEVIHMVRTYFNLQIPIIAVTAQTFFNENHYLEKRGFSGYISKPFLLSTLLETIYKSTEGILQPCDKKEIFLKEEEPTDDLEIAYTYLKSLEPVEFKKWKEALEMTDVESLSELIRAKHTPNLLKNVIHNQDYRFLLQLDERLQNDIIN